MSEKLTIRPEAPADGPAIRRLNDAAFGQPDEGEIVDRLRATLTPETGELWISLVAETGSEIVGHILFTEVSVRAGSRTDPLLAVGAGLAPMAVLPDLQNRGIGSRLVEEGLSACRAAGRELVVVLGHPAYYPRFGFAPADDFGLRWEHEVPSEAFLLLELTPGAASSLAGTVFYRPEFTA